MAINVGNICNHSFLEDFISDKSCVFDCGVNSGEFSSEISNKFHSIIYGFEPDPRLFHCLPKIDKCIFYQLAIYDKKDTLILNLGDSICSSLYFNEGAHENHCLVETTSIPDFCYLNGINKIDLLKLDIEGAEIVVLKDLQEDFLINTVVQITVEFHEFMDVTVIPEIKQIIARLKELGFYYFHFSRTYGDVLFVNQNFIKLSIFFRFKIILTKYQRGITRFVGRLINNIKPQAN